MYYYIVDPQKLSQREFERVQNLLYSSLSEYRVSGEIMRVTGLRTVNQLVENAFAHGAKTIVAVGSDDTFHDVINAIKNREMVVGFVPLAESEIGNILGIKNIEHAAKTLGARRIAELDLGSVNNNLFLTKLSFGISQTNPGLLETLNLKFLQNLFQSPSFQIKFSVNGQYSANLNIIGGIIVNSRDSNERSDNFDPIDGVLDVLLVSKLSKWEVFQFRRDLVAGNFEKIPGSSIIHIDRLEISTPTGLPLKIGNRVIGKTPAIVEIIPKALKIIVGKDRKF